jgi:multidrug resistance efflux pump
VINAEQEVFNIENGYNDINLQNAKNQVIQSQSNVDTVRKKYENYQMIANFDGTITEMSVQV